MEEIAAESFTEINSLSAEFAEPFERIQSKINGLKKKRLESLISVRDGNEKHDELITIETISQNIMDLQNDLIYLKDLQFMRTLNVMGLMAVKMGFAYNWFSIPTTFGSRLKEERIKQGVTLCDFAKRVGLEPQYLLNIESGQVNPAAEQKETFEAFLEGRL